MPKPSRSSSGAHTQAMGVPIADGVPVSASEVAGSNVPVAIPIPPNTPSGRRVHVINESPRLAVSTAPHGALPGGRWAEVSFFGANSLLCCFAWLLVAPPVACFVPLMPCDRTLVYVAPDGVVWHDDGSR